MPNLTRLLLLASFAISARPLLAQMPFYTDNADVTGEGTLHFEFFNEYDDLQSAQYPNLRQNWANLKINYGMPHSLELDFDAPYLAIYRASPKQDSSGHGDVDCGVKWNFHKQAHPMSVPALSASFYVEFPTGDAKQELGSGLRDYWLNSIAQEAISEKTRLNANFGYLFAGNTSTGVIGIQTTRGEVYTGGVSLLHDFNSRVTFGIEAYGAIDNNNGLGKDQLQGLAGGQYQLNSRMAFTFAALGGAHIASPRIGGQFGFEVDFPVHHAQKQSARNQPLLTPISRRSP